MKNILQLNGEINRINKIDPDYIKPAALRREKKNKELCKLLIKYLEHSPSEEFVNSEIEKLEKLLSSKMKEFDPDVYQKLPKKEVAKLKKEHEAVYGLPKVRNQIRTLRYLLS